jgi:hypothetical protein
VEIKHLDLVVIMVQEVAVAVMEPDMQVVEVEVLGYMVSVLQVGMALMVVAVVVALVHLVQRVQQVQVDQEVPMVSQRDMVLLPAVHMEVVLVPARVLR